MEKIFKELCAILFTELKNDELLTLTFSGENSQFIRINNASIRQIGLVDDATPVSYTHLTLPTKA